LSRAPARLAASILSADFSELGTAIAAVERGGADLIHVDVMDGHFVPNISIGQPVVKAVKRVATLPLDVHLMITDPDRYAPGFVEAGADMLSVHIEVLTHPERSVAAIKKLGVKVGVVLSPPTPAGALEPLAADVDFVLVMSVHPGFGGQKFMPASLDKIRALRAMLDRAGNRAPIEIDGGIDLSNIAQAVAAGADILVTGSAIYNTPDPIAATRALKNAAIAS
jgi:ribulose-phosphate 3-epimerase